MSATTGIDQIPNLDSLGNVVPPGYTYYEKLIAPGGDLALPSAYLKWYDLYPADAPITPEQAAESRAFLTTRVQPPDFEGDLGFVILHRAGSMLLLLLTTWRNTNEMWESIYVKEADSPDDYQPIVFDGDHRGTYCVWELGIVWHERHAWVRFLSSPRDNAAKLAYVQDRFSGRI